VGNTLTVKKVSESNLVAGSKSLCLDNTLRPLASRMTSIYKNASSLLSTLTQLSYSKTVIEIMMLIYLSQIIAMCILYLDNLARIDI
jgi:hypothetical protein